MSEPGAELIEELAVPHRAGRAYWRLMALGRMAVPAARAGLTHESADVRFHCARYFDHFLMPDILGDLMLRLDDPDPRVRLTALHTLACDRCKDDMCVPSGGALLDKAMTIVSADTDAHVRAHAIELLGRAAHENAAALDALQAAHRDDPSPAVRKKAGWYVPGGPIWRRTAARARRRRAA
jgi:HEAT repeat protein